MARVVLARSATVALKGLGYLVAGAVLDALGELERDPVVGHALRGRVTGLWSYRVGACRIIYQLRDESTVRVVAIRHRGDAYTSGPRYPAVSSAADIGVTLCQRRRWIRPHNADRSARRPPGNPLVRTAPHVCWSQRQAG